MCIFQYPFSRKFRDWRKFRSKPRLKKIVTGGGVVQVGQKWAPQGTFHRNFTPPHEIWELIRGKFFSSEVDFFACRKFCKKFRENFDQNFMIFCQKISPRGMVFSRHFLTPKIDHFFSHFFGHFFRDFFMKFLIKFSCIFLENFRRYFLEYFLLKNAPLFNKQQSHTLSNAGRNTEELLISIMSSSSSCKRAVARPRASSKACKLLLSVETSGECSTLP